MGATGVPDATIQLHDGVRAEMLGMLDRAAEAYRRAAESENPDVRAEALWRQADVLRVQCDGQGALASARRAQEVAHTASLARRYAEALNAEASVYISRGEYARARTLLERMVASTRDLRLRGIGLQNLGSVHAREGDLELAERVFAESHVCFRGCGYERGEAIALNNQGRAALDRGDVERATRILERAETAARHVEDEELLALSTANLADAVLAGGDDDRAHDLVCTALGHFRASGNRWREIECLRLLGTINARRGCPEEARRCWERALRLAREIDSRPDEEELLALLSGERGAGSGE
jgi:tetratricopeptide (TPR) repeat protein